MAYNIHFPTALGAGTGGTAAPVIHCFGAQRGRRGLPRSENEANSHWSVLKTRAFWSEVVSLWGTHFEFFLWLFFFEIAIGFLAIALLPWKRSDLFQTFKRHLCHMSINPTLAKKNWNSLQLHDHHLPPPPIFAHSAWHHWRYHISHRQSAAMGDPCRSYWVRTAEHLKRSRS